MQAISLDMRNSSSNTPMALSATPNAGGENSLVLDKRYNYDSLKLFPFFDPILSCCSLVECFRLVTFTFSECFPIVSVIVDIHVDVLINFGCIAVVRRKFIESTRFVP